MTNEAICLELSHGLRLYGGGAGGSYREIIMRQWFPLWWLLLLFQFDRTRRRRRSISLGHLGFFFLPRARDYYLTFQDELSLSHTQNFKSQIHPLYVHLIKKRLETIM